MGKKVFISYKYADKNVASLNSKWGTTCRDYVNEIQERLEETPHIYKAEEDDNDLSKFKDDTIASKLRDKIYDSTVTIVLISKGMKTWETESEQWIPWEISYSLKEHSRDGRTSLSNAILGVVIPDEYNNYDYFMVDNTCQYCHCRTLKTDFLFKILRENMFNIKSPLYTDCNNHNLGSKPYSGESSYIRSVKWSDFINNINTYIDIAVNINDNINNYNISKTA